MSFGYFFAVGSFVEAGSSRSLFGTSKVLPSSMEMMVGGVF